VCSRGHNIGLDILYLLTHVFVACRVVIVANNDCINKSYIYSVLSAYINSDIFSLINTTCINSIIAGIQVYRYTDTGIQIQVYNNVQWKYRRLVSRRVTNEYRFVFVSRR